ncbi:hypothetical protein BraRD5C2_23830 [Bradyrhizobium sp. RD5-C2]|nr:hypothetical protein BraRD5C2_23830 [Bradyrhizobium sp. RD5-C2]
MLISAGASPDSVLVGWRRGEATWALRARLGTAATFTIDEYKARLARWKAFSSSAVGAQKRYSEGEATLPSESPNASLCEQDASSSSNRPLSVVDPPPKRRSPRTASARANSTSDNAALGSNYTEETSTSSQTLTRDYLSNGSARER